MPCFCGGEFKVIRRDTEIRDEGVFLILHFKCKLCGKEFTSDLMEQEKDWEGLK